MDWIWLLIAGGLEVGWVVGLKATAGFTKPGPSVLTLIGMVASVACLAVAARTIPLGVAYAVWTGIGTVGAVVLGIVLHDEPANALKCVFIGLIVAGIIGLKVTAADS